MMRNHAKLAALAATLTAGFALPIMAQDLIVEGCNERLSGEVGIWQGVGNVGEQIAVPITVNTTNDIDAFILDVDLPPGVLSYVRTEPGGLMPTNGTLGGHYFATTHQVRIEGIISDGSGIPAGSVGQIAVLIFEVTAAGSGAFGTSRLLDDLSTYVSCEDIHGTTVVEPQGWGRIKAWYR